MIVSNNRLDIQCCWVDTSTGANRPKVAIKVLTFSQRLIRICDYRPSTTQLMDRVIDKVRSKVFIAIEEIYINILFASLAGVTIRGCFAGSLAIGPFNNATWFYYLTKHSLVNEVVDKERV